MEEFMNTITERDRIMQVCKRWLAQYPIGSSNPEFIAIYHKLLQVDLRTCTGTDIANIIGNDSWTRMQCSECGLSVNWVLVVGEAPHYESNTAYLCKECLKRAAQYIDQNE